MSDKQVLGAMVEELETISSLLTRYATFEGLYLRHDSAARKELEEALVSMYAEILEYISRAKHYFQKSTASELSYRHSTDHSTDSSLERVLESAFQPDEDQHMNRIVTKEVRVSDLAKLVDAEGEIESPFPRGTNERIMDMLNCV